MQITKNLNKKLLKYSFLILNQFLKSDLIPWRNLIWKIRRRWARDEFQAVHIFYKLGIKDINLYLFFQVNLDSGMRFADHRART